MVFRSHYILTMMLPTGSEEPIESIESTLYAFIAPIPHCPCDMSITTPRTRKSFDRFILYSLVNVRSNRK